MKNKVRNKRCEGRAAKVLALLLLTSTLVPLPSARATDVAIQLNRATDGGAIAHRKIIITPLDIDSAGGGLAAGDTTVTNTDANGFVIVSNMAPGHFTLEITAPPNKKVYCISVPQSPDLQYLTNLTVLFPERIYPPGFTTYSEQAIDSKLAALVLESGSGNVVGPGSSQQHHVAAFANTSGQLLEDTGLFPWSWQATNQNLTLWGSFNPTTYSNGLFAAFGSGGGSGNVTGPGSSTVNDIAAWNSSLGTVLKDSGVPFASLLSIAGFQTFTNTLGTAAFQPIASFITPAQQANLSNNLNGANVTLGIINFAHLGTGGGGSSKFLREDNTFQTIAGGGDMLSANNLGDVASAPSALANLGGAAAATTLTLNGTSSQISSSAGAQSLGANRTWTLSFPNAVIFPGTVAVPSLLTIGGFKVPTTNDLTQVDAASSTNNGVFFDANGKLVGGPVLTNVNVLSPGYSSSGPLSGVFSGTITLIQNADRDHLGFSETNINILSASQLFSGGFLVFATNNLTSNSWWSIVAGGAANGPGTHFGVGANGTNQGAAFGVGASGHDDGAGFGDGANGAFDGATIGRASDASQHGANVGEGGNASSGGANVGEQGNGSINGANIGSGGNGNNEGFAGGFNTFGFSNGVAAGAFADGHGFGNVAIGSYDANTVTLPALIPNTWTYTVELGAGTATLQGGLNFRTFPVMNTNGVHTGNGFGLTNLDTHFTNYGAVTNIVLPADGNAWRVLATNGPHNFFTFAGNNMGAMSIWITTNGDAQWPAQVQMLGYSNHLTTNCIIDLQPWGGTNKVLGGESEL